MSKSDEHTNPSENFKAAPPKIPDHRLLRLIGRGSYGEVWLALNAMNKWTAVKIVHRGSGDGRAYEQEFRGLRRYDDLSGSDGSLMPIKNVGENTTAGYFYYAMELADDAGTRQPLPRAPSVGHDLVVVEHLAENYQPWTLSEELRRHGRLKPQDCIEYGLALAESLHVLHQGNLVHRDVKPSNIIFVNGRPKLADVGLVAATDATMNSLAGTSGFVPLHGQGKLTGDIFALGKVLYMAATGNDVLHFPQAIHNFDKLPDDERRDLAELEAVYERACDPSPEDRQPSAQALRDELEMLRRNESVVRLRQLEEENERREIMRQKTQRRRKKLAIFSLAGVVAVAITIAALLAYTWQLSVTRQAAVAQLQASKLSRMLVRRSGWSQRDWQRIDEAAKRKLDDAITSQAVSTLSGLDARIVSQWLKAQASSVAFAPDGRVLFAGFGASKATLISNVTNGTELPVIGEGRACWSPDGEPSIWQRGNNSCVLRDARTGNVRREFPLALGEQVAVGNIPVMAVTPDGSLAAAGLVGTSGARLVVWDTRDGRTLGEAHRAVRALSISPDGSFLAAGDEAGKTTIWSTKPFALLAELAPGKRPNAITCLAFGEDRVVPRGGTNETRRWLLAVGDSGAGIVIWDLAKRLPRSFCPGSDYNIQSLAFSPDGISLASAGRGNVRVWDLMSGFPLLQIDGIGGSDAPALAYDATGERLAVGTIAASSASFVGLVELEPHRGIQRLRGLNFQIRKVWFSQNSRLIAALADDWSLAVWETESGRLRHLFEAAGVLADNVGGAFDGDGAKFGFAAGSEARLYDLQTGRTLGKWPLPRGDAEEIQFDAHNSLLLVRKEVSPENPNNRGCISYELPMGKEALPLHKQTEFGYQIISMIFPIPGSQFVAITEDQNTKTNSVRAFDVLTGNQLWQVDQHRVVFWDKFVTSADQKWCGFAVGDSGLTHFVRTVDGAFSFALPERCFAIDPSGQTYAAQSDKRELWFLRSVNGSSPPMLMGFDGQYINDTFAFSPDGRRVVCGATDGAVLLADIKTVREQVSKLGRK